MTDTEEGMKTDPRRVPRTGQAPGERDESSPKIVRRVVAESVATAFLVAIVIGSGIAAERLSDSTGLALLINAVSVGAGLVALILAFGPASGAHMNPVVSAVEVALGDI